MKLKKLTLILTTLLLAVSFMTAQERKEKPTIVVIPFEAKNVEQNDADVLLEIFTNEIAGTGKFKVVDRSNVDKIREQHKFQNSEWSNDEKVAKLGEALNANIVVTGQLMPFKDKIVVSFRMVDVNTMEIVSSASTKVNDISEFFDVIPDIVKKLTGEIESISTSSSSKTTPAYNKNKTYNVGDDGPGGGIIFYHSEAGFDVYEPDGSVKKCHYLEVSKFDLGKIRWCTKKDYNTSCCDITTTLTAIGAGRINTFKIIKGYHSGGTLTKENCAALACHSYSTATTKAGDWFLPSKDELNLLYQNLGKRVMLSNTTNSKYYWSSSQDDNDYSCGQRFSDGNQSINYRGKSNTNSVRAVRAF